MDNKKNIGKKVWIANDYVKIVNKDNPAIIVGIKPAKAVGDSCDHFIIKLDGKLLEEREYQCVFTPEEMEDKSINFSKYLSENGLYPDDVSEYSDGSVEVDIRWGDWRHEHAWCDRLMSYLDYDCKKEEITEENGSDCYSATHYYSKNV